MSISRVNMRLTTLGFQNHHILEKPRCLAFYTKVTPPYTLKIHQSCHENYSTKFHNYSLIFPWPFHKNTNWNLESSSAAAQIHENEESVCQILWLSDQISKFHDIPMTLTNSSQNSMTLPEIPENYKITEIQWMFNDCGNPCACMVPLINFADPPWERMHAY